MINTIKKTFILKKVVDLNDFKRFDVKPTIKKAQSNINFYFERKNYLFM